MFTHWKKEMQPYYNEALIDHIPEIAAVDKDMLGLTEELSDGAKKYLLDNFQIDLKATPLALATLVWGYQKNVLQDPNVSYSNICNQANYYNIEALRLLYAGKQLKPPISLINQGITSLISERKIQEQSQELEEYTNNKLKIEINSSPDNSILNQIIFIFGLPLFIPLGKSPSDEICAIVNSLYEELVHVKTNATSLISAILDDGPDLKDFISEFFDNFLKTLQSEYEIENAKTICDELNKIYTACYATENTIRDPFIFFKDCYKETATNDDKRKVVDIDEEKCKQDPKYATAARQFIDKKIINKEVYKTLLSICLQLIKIREEKEDIPELGQLYQNTIITKFALTLFKKKYLIHGHTTKMLSEADEEMKALLGSLHHITLFLKGAELSDLQENVDLLKIEFEKITTSKQLTEKATEYTELNLPKKIASLAKMLLDLKKVFDKFDPNCQLIVNDISVTEVEGSLLAESTSFLLPLSQSLEELAHLSKEASSLFTNKYREIEAALQEEREEEQAALASQVILEFKRQAEELATQERQYMAEILREEGEAQSRRNHNAQQAALQEEGLRNTITINNDKFILDECDKITNNGTTFYILCAKDALLDSKESEDDFKEAQAARNSFAAKQGQIGVKFLKNLDIHELKIVGNPRIFGDVTKVKNENGKEENLIYFSKFCANPHGNKNTMRTITEILKQNPPKITYHKDYAKKQHPATSCADAGAAAVETSPTTKRSHSRK